MSNYIDLYLINLYVNDLNQDKKPHMYNTYSLHTSESVDL